MVLEEWLSTHLRRHGPVGGVDRRRSLWVSFKDRFGTYPFHPALFLSHPPLHLARSLPPSLHPSPICVVPAKPVMVRALIERTVKGQCGWFARHVLVVFVSVELCLLKWRLTQEGGKVIGLDHGQWRLSFITPLSR